MDERLDGRRSYITLDRGTNNEGVKEACELIRKSKFLKEVVDVLTFDGLKELFHEMYLV